MVRTVRIVMDSDNYVGKLKEIADQRGLIVSYEDVGSEGPDHMKKFTIRASVNGKTYPDGVGHCKKDARQDAAKKAWMCLSEESSDFKDSVGVEASLATPVHIIKYTSWLNHYCQEKKLPFSHEESIRIGPESNKYECYFLVNGEKCSPGRGKNKKEAREQAAKMVYDKISGIKYTNDEIGNESGMLSRQPEKIEKSLSDDSERRRSSTFEESSCGKSDFVSLINLHCQQKRIQPSFVQVKKSGDSHCPTFFYQLLLNEKEYPGEGGSVKKAKQRAAELAWNEIKRESECSSKDSESNATSAGVEDSGNVSSSSSHTATTSDSVIFTNTSHSTKNQLQSPNVRPKVRIAANFASPGLQSKDEGINFQGKEKTPTESGSASYKSTNRFRLEYDSIKSLNKGKFGRVYEAKHKLENKLCAVKIIPFNDREKVLEEVRVLSDLSHPNIVRYFTCWIEDWDYPWDGSTESSTGSQSSSDTPVKYLYIQMELCSAKTLRDWIDGKNNPNQSKPPLKGDAGRRKEGLALAIQIVNGVEYIHSKTLVHRDLKPANILFDREEKVKIGDFGLVTAVIEDDVKNQEDRSKFKGTPSYMAPEQKGGTVYDHKVDMFALALIYYELVWLFRTSMERSQIWSEIKKQNLPLDFSGHFFEESQIIKPLLSSDPRERPEASQVKADLEKLNHELQKKMTQSDSKTVA